MTPTDMTAERRRVVHDILSLTRTPRVTAHHELAFPPSPDPAANVMEQQPRTTPLVQYPTRLDGFRVEHAINHRQWAAEAGLSRTHFDRIRRGEGVTLETLARVVRAASRLLNRPVRASELVDLGEEEPVAMADRRRTARRRKSKRIRHVFDSPLDRLLVEHDIEPALLARQARLASLTLRRIRAERQSLSTSTAALIIRALRDLGLDVKARDLWDVGED